jgi:hypothetical protein
VLHANFGAIIANALARTNTSSYLFERDPLRVKRTSAWRLTTRSRRGGNPPSYALPVRLLGHLLSTALVYLALLFLTWGVSQCFVWLSSSGQLPEDATDFLGKLKLVVLYGEGSVFAYFWATGAWHLFKEMRR